MAGFWYGVAAYGIWGLFPLYWKLIQHVPALQILVTASSGRSPRSPF